ncbi:MULTISPECIES: O-antigen polymerase [Streptococcus]|uniref:O-antigen polymerase n=1 Tax=Streptococcus TaxID=1301 RepID=UPI00132EEE59|nr:MULTISPECIES: O-antigen polymerase [Streptococcus]QHF55057.1 hypothetical protein BZG42_06770 [Streptococcus sp. DAT741]
MNILFIFASLLLVFLYSLQIKNDFASPGFLYLSIWSVVSFFSLIFLRGEDISFTTVLIILVGNILFSQSVYFSRIIIKAKTIQKEDDSFINQIVLICLIAFCLFMYWYIYRDLQEISKLVESSTNFNKVLEGARYVSTHSIARIGYLAATFNRVNYSLGLVVFYYFCKQIFYPKSNSVSSLQLLIVSLLCLSGSILSAGRSELLGMLMGYVSIYLLFYSKKWTWEFSKYSSKILKYLIRVGIGFIFLFLIIGVFILNRTGANRGETLLVNLAKYIGSSIGALNYYLNNTSQYPENTVWGQNMFLALYSTLNTLGLYSGERIVFLPSTIIQGTTTNVYTIYYYLIQDFGIFFGIFTQMLYGFIFGSLYYFIKKRYFNKYAILLYATLSQAIVMSFFAEQFFSVFTNHLIRFFIVVVILVLISLTNRIRLKL